MTKLTKAVTIGIIALIFIISITLIGIELSDKITGRVPAVLEKGYKIGAVLPLTGGAAAYGESWKKGVDLAIDVFEKKYREKVTVIYEDSAMEPAKSVSAVQKMINIDGVSAIIIGSSGETLPVAPIAEANKVLLMTSSTNPAITNAGDYIFRINPSDNYQGNDLADLAVSKGYKNVAVLHVMDDYGKGITDVFEKAMAKRGGKVVAIESFAVQETSDFRTGLLKIAGKNPDALLIIAQKQNYPVIFKQINELGIKLPLLAGETMYDQDVLDVSGGLAEGVLFTAFREPEESEFITLHNQRYGTNPGAYAAGFYDNTMLVLEALHSSKGDVNGAKQWLYSVKNWKGATGTTTFDKNGDVVGKSNTVFVVRNNQFVPFN